MFRAKSDRSRYTTPNRELVIGLDEYMACCNHVLVAASAKHRAQARATHPRITTASIR
jgi:hypothetical protein